MSDAVIAAAARQLRPHELDRLAKLAQHADLIGLDTGLVRLANALSSEAPEPEPFRLKTEAELRAMSRDELAAYKSRLGGAVLSGEVAIGPGPNFPAVPSSPSPGTDKERK